MTSNGYYPYAGENEYQTVRCPVCGGGLLDAVYDDSRRRSSFLWGGLLGVLLDRIRNRNVPQSFWVCRSCGHSFPMELRRR